MVLPAGSMSGVRAKRIMPDRAEHDSMPQDMPNDSHPMVPDRATDTMDSQPDSPPQEVHIALVIPDTKGFRRLSKSAYIIQDAARKDVVVKLHVLEGPDPEKNPEEATSLVLRNALTRLGLVTPKVAALQYPEEIELGWQEEQPL